MDDRPNFAFYKEKVPVTMARILRSGEESKWLAIYGYKHHWSYWRFLNKHYANCLKKINSTEGVTVGSRSIRVQSVSPDRLSFPVGQEILVN